MCRFGGIHYAVLRVVVDAATGCHQVDFLHGRDLLLLDLIALARR
jgi:hypothetical protein